MKSNFYIESIEPLVANNFYDLVQLDSFCTLYQVENDTRSNVCFFSYMNDNDAHSAEEIGVLM